VINVFRHKHRKHGNRDIVGILWNHDQGDLCLMESVYFPRREDHARTDHGNERTVDGRQGANAMTIFQRVRYFLRISLAPCKADEPVLRELKQTNKELGQALSQLTKEKHNGGKRAR